MDTRTIQYFQFSGSATFFSYLGFFFLKTKGDEDIGIRVRVRVQKSKVCCVPLPEKAVCSLIFLKSLFNISDSILK